MEIPILKDLVIIFGLAVVVLWVCHRLKLPSIVGLLFTGIASGPHGLGLIENIADVETLSQVGIILLLFAIGLDFSLKKLLQYKRFFFLGGAIQVGLTVLFGYLIAKMLGRPNGESVFLGFLLAMSSTAIVLKALEIHDDTDSPQGSTCLGILIFQDIIAVPMILAIPTLSGVQQSFNSDFFISLFSGLGIIIITVVAALKITPVILYHIAMVRSRELFLLSILTICFAVAWLASFIGLSLAIGAFLAGLIISESEYRHEVLSNILPLQDIFASLFFVSIGMLLDLNFVFQQPFLILLIATGIILMKSLLVAITTFCLNLPLRVIILSSIALSQIGEFSFVLVKTGMDYGLGTEYNFQLFLAVAILTMAVTPTLIDYSKPLANFILKWPWPEKWKTGLSHEVHHVKYQNHILIIGYGIAGRNLAKASKAANLPYAIIEMNPITVKEEKLTGEPIHFGDATHETVLNHLHIKHARAIAIVINDSEAVKRIVTVAHKLNPSAYLLVRTRYLKDVGSLRKLGAHEVIPEEFGTSIEIFVRVLKHYKIPQTEIDIYTENFRSECLQNMI